MWPLDGSREEEGLFVFRSFVSPNIVYTINALDGTCSCHMYGQRSICVHLLAATSLPEVGMEESLLPCLDDLEDSSLLEFARRVRLRRDLAAEEPLGPAFNEELNLLAGIRSQHSRARDAFPAEVRTVLSQCDRLKGIAKELDGDTAAMLSTKLEALVLEASDLRTKFKATTVAAGKQMRRQHSRQPDQRVQHALFPGRKKSAAAVTARGGGGGAGEAGGEGEQAEEDGRTEEGDASTTPSDGGSSDDGEAAAPTTFAPVQGPGRPRTRERGWEGLVRSGKGGKRQKRQ